MNFEMNATVGDLERYLGKDYKLYLGFGELDNNDVLQNVKTDSRRKINIIDISRLRKLEKQGRIEANYVYSVEKQIGVFDGKPGIQLKISGIESEDLIDKSEYFTQVTVNCKKVLLNERYPDHSFFFNYFGVKIYSNEYNSSNGILGEIRTENSPRKYVFISDSVVVFDFPEEIIEFYSFEEGLFPNFFVKSKNYIYFINQDKLMKLYSKFDPIEFEADYFAKKYKSEKKIPRRVIADVSNTFNVDISEIETCKKIDKFIKSGRLLNKDKFNAKILAYKKLHTEDEIEFNNDEHFECYYY